MRTCKSYSKKCVMSVSSAVNIDAQLCVRVTAISASSLKGKLERKRPRLSWENIRRNHVESIVFQPSLDPRGVGKKQSDDTDALCQVLERAAQRLYIVLPKRRSTRLRNVTSVTVSLPLNTSVKTMDLRPG